MPAEREILEAQWLGDVQFTNVGGRLNAAMAFRRQHIPGNWIYLKAKVEGALQHVLFSNTKALISNYNDDYEFDGGGRVKLPGFRRLSDGPIMDVVRDVREEMRIEEEVDRRTRARATRPSQVQFDEVYGGARPTRVQPQRSWVNQPPATPTRTVISEDAARKFGGVGARKLDL